MTESIGKRFNQQDSSLNKLLIRDESDLNFSKGFTYKDQNLDNVHNSADEMKEINRTKLEGYIGEKIPTKQMTDEEISKYFDGLTDQQARWIGNKAKTNEYDQNTLVSYVNHWNEWVNPYAEGTGMYEKKTADNVSPNSNIGKIVKGGLWTLAGLEAVGETSLGIGNYQLNKTVDKYAPEDVSRLIRHAKYEDVPKILSEQLKETEEEITKSVNRLEKLKGKSAKKTLVDEATRQNLEDLYARRDSIKETLDAFEETKKKLPNKKPETTRETAKSMKLKGSDLTAAGQAATEQTVYYATEIAPLYKQVKTKFNISKILGELTKDDFEGLTEKQRTAMKEYIDEEAELYSKYGDLSAEEAHKKLNDFKLDKTSIQGEDPNGNIAKFKKAAYTKINNAITDAVEKELPGSGIKNKNLVYNNMGNISDELGDYAVSGGKRNPQSGILKDLKDSTIKSPTKYRAFGNGWRTLGNTITPRVRVQNLYKWLTKNKSKVNDVAKKIEEKSPEVANKAKEKAQVAAKNFKQPNLFDSAANSAFIVAEYLNEKMGMEAPSTILTEIISYAFETNKLNKEGNRDLPLYNKEKSYVNQNPNAGNFKIKKDNSIYEQDWYKQLQEEENLKDEEYRNFIENVDIDEILKSLE